MKRAFALASLALLTFGAALVASPPSADAASVTKSAWWSHTSDPGTLTPPAAQSPVATVPQLPATPPRPDVPEGSLLVEGTPSGATAIAAITFALIGDESNPILTITPSSSSNVPADAVLLACRASVAWQAPESEPGAWGDKPLVDCGRSVNGIVADGTITFALAPIVSGDTLDVVIVPGMSGQSTPTVPVGSTFSLSFDTAKGATMATTPAPPEPFSSPTTVPSPASATLTPTPAFTAPSAPAPVAAPALEPQEQAPSVPQQTALPPTRPLKDDNKAQGVGFLILLGGLAFAGLAYATPAGTDDGLVGLGRFRRPAPALANTVAAEPVSGGLGRFTRPRTGPPPALS